MALNLGCRTLRQELLLRVTKIKFFRSYFNTSRILLFATEHFYITGKEPAYFYFQPSRFKSYIAKQNKVKLLCQAMCFYGNQLEHMWPQTLLTVRTWPQAGHERIQSNDICKLLAYPSLFKKIILLCLRHLYNLNNVTEAL